MDSSAGSQTQADACKLNGTQLAAGSASRSAAPTPARWGQSGHQPAGRPANLGREWPLATETAARFHVGERAQSGLVVLNLSLTRLTDAVEKVVFLLVIALDCAERF